MNNKILNNELISRRYIVAEDFLPAEGYIAVDLEAYARARKIIKKYDKKKISLSEDFDDSQYLIGGCLVKLPELLIHEYQITIYSETRKGARNLAALLGLPFDSNKRISNDMGERR